MKSKMNIRVRYLGILLFGLLVACSGGDTTTFRNSEPLVSSARIDSLEIIQITVFLESEFGVDLPIDPSTNLMLSLSM